jgi:hypothetical protein
MDGWTNRRKTDVLLVSLSFSFRYLPILQRKEEEEKNINQVDLSELGTQNSVLNNEQGQG